MKWKIVILMVRRCVFTLRRCYVRGWVDSEAIVQPIFLQMTGISLQPTTYLYNITCCRDLYLTIHNRHTCPGEIQTHDLSRRATTDRQRVKLKIGHCLTWVDCYMSPDVRLTYFVLVYFEYKTRPHVEKY